VKEIEKLINNGLVGKAVTAGGGEGELSVTVW
jgi:hypothetical protein